MAACFGELPGVKILLGRLGHDISVLLHQQVHEVLHVVTKHAQPVLLLGRINQGGA